MLSTFSMYCVYTVIMYRISEVLKNDHVTKIVEVQNLQVIYLMRRFNVSYRKANLLRSIQMKELYKVSAQEARVQLSDMINRAVYSRQPSLITRQGKPAAVLIAFDQWQDFKQWQQKKDTLPMVDADSVSDAVFQEDSFDQPLDGTDNE